MKKKFLFILVLAVTMTVLFTACGKDKEDAGTTAPAKDVKTQEAADAIRTQGDFKDQLATVHNTTALTRLYVLDEANIEEAAFYTNSSSTAEEIAVIKVKSQDYIDTVKAAYEKRIEDQKDACKDYLPDEMPKLDSAVIYVNGNYAVLCISNDNSKMEGIIKGIFE